VDYTSAKVKINQSWRYKTLTVIKRHKTTYFYLCSGNAADSRLQGFDFNGHLRPTFFLCMIGVKNCSL